MSTRRMTSTLSRSRPWMDELADRVPGGRRNLQAGIALMAAVGVAFLAHEIVSARRVAQWAPVDVVDSRDPLQDLPIRLASAGGEIRPAPTYDAVLDLKAIDHLVVGVDLDYLPRRGAPRDVVIRTSEGEEKFRDHVPESYFTQGRFMLRLFSKHFPSGEYMLEIEAHEQTGEVAVVAASWFQVEQ